MKKRILVLLSLLTVISASAQNGFRGAYFMDGYLYNHMMNPAFMSDRNYFGLGVGRIDLQNQTDLGVSTFFYPRQGSTQLFLSDYVSTEEFLSKIARHNPEDLNVQEDVLQLGFRSQNGRFHTFGISLRVSAQASAPYDLFRFLKDGSSDSDTYSLGGLGGRLRGFAQIAYGQSVPITETIRVGAKVKGLVGLAYMNLKMDTMDVTLGSDAWNVRTDGRLFDSGIPVSNVSSGTLGELYDLDNYDWSKYRPTGFGAAFDLGATWDVLPWLQLSASILDLGFIHWKAGHDMQASGSWVYTGFEDIDVSGENSFQARLDEKREELTRLAQFSPAGTGSPMDWLPASFYLGAKAHPLKWCSAGILATARADGPYSWGEIRGAVNLEPIRWFGLSGSAAWGSFGPKLSSALNFRLPLLALFAGVEFSNPHFVKVEEVLDEDLVLPNGALPLPRDNWNIHLSLGLNMYFGPRRDRPRTVEVLETVETVTE